MIDVHNNNNTNHYMEMYQNKTKIILNHFKMVTFVKFDVFKINKRI